jgi:pimeloyl-ACP methyl ester carboxylesterase
MDSSLVLISSDTIHLEGELGLPDHAQGLVVFAHGSGSGRHSPRNQAVATHLQEAGLATLLMDLLTAEEEHEERYTRHHRFDIQLLCDRLVSATDFVSTLAETAHLPIGYFGASTGAAAALAAAASLGDRIEAVVSRGGRPDLAGATLAVVTSPTLLIVGGADGPVIKMNREAMGRMISACVRVEIIPGATHLFGEPGTLERVAELSAAWFQRHLGRNGGPATR